MGGGSKRSAVRTVGVRTWRVKNKKGWILTPRSYEQKRTKSCAKDHYRSCKDELPKRDSMPSELRGDFLAVLQGGRQETV